VGSGGGNVGTPGLFCFMGWGVGIVVFLVFLNLGATEQLEFQFLF
jgi:hypothetical protein